MSQYYSKEKIYMKVGTSDFSALTRTQLESFVSILHRISPDMAIMLMNSFIDFRMTANNMVGIIRSKVLKMPERKKDQHDMRLKCMGMLKELDLRLSQQIISEKDKLFIENYLILLACMLKADTKDRRIKAMKVLSLVGAGVILVVAALFLLAALVPDSDSTEDKSEPDGDKNESYGLDDEPEDRQESSPQSKARYQVMMYYPDGTSDLDEEIFETEGEAEEYGAYLVSCCRLGAEILNASNPYEYPDSDYEADFSIVKIDE